MSYSKTINPTCFSHVLHSIEDYIKYYVARDEISIYLPYYNIIFFVFICVINFMHSYMMRACIVVFRITYGTCEYFIS